MSEDSGTDPNADELGLLDKFLFLVVFVSAYPVIWVVLNFEGGLRKIRMWLEND